jgi:hypothetical protein
VSVLADTSSWLDADDTVSTMRPTAVSKSSAILFMSALRLATARLSAARCSTSSDCCATALLLNTSTALAISPISSPRPTPGTSISSLPLARSFMATVMRRNGAVMLRATKIDTTSMNSRMAPATIRERWVATQVCAFKSSI